LPPPRTTAQTDSDLSELTPWTTPPLAFAPTVPKMLVPPEPSPEAARTEPPPTLASSPPASSPPPEQTVTARQTAAAPQSGPAPIAQPTPPLKVKAIAIGAVVGVMGAVLIYELLIRP
jgi:hypothetical protein